MKPGWDGLGCRVQSVGLVFWKLGIKAWGVGLGLGVGRRCWDLGITLRVQVPNN